MNDMIIPHYFISLRHMRNITKGGDFMELETEIGRMIWEGCPNVEEPGVKNSRFPEVVGRTQPEAILPGVQGIAEGINKPT